MDPIDMDLDLDWGTIAVSALHVEPMEAGVGEIAARVRLTVVLKAAESPLLNVSLDDEGCSGYAPPSAPSSPVAHVSAPLPDDRRNQTYEFDEALRGTAQLGPNASVFVWVEADNAIGPIFGRCVEFERLARE